MEKLGFVWTDRQQQAFDILKEKLLEASALGLPDINKPFYLLVNEHNGLAKGVLTQTVGPSKKPIAYLSKKMHPMVSGWTPCLLIIATVALLVKDVEKLTLGQNLLIAFPHALEGALKQPPDWWLSNAQMTHYQVFFLNPARITFQVLVVLNPATLLQDP